MNDYADSFDVTNLEAYTTTEGEISELESNIEDLEIEIQGLEEEENGD